MPIRSWSRARILLAALVVSGCSSGGTGASGGSAADTCPRNGVVPADLRDVERNGEGLVATTFGGYPGREPDWARAATVLSLLEVVWTRTASACPALPSSEATAVDQAIATLKQAISAGDQKSAAIAANAVGLAVPALFDYFHPDAPIEVVRMDAVFRQVGIDAHFGSADGAIADVASLAKDWASSKAAVEARVPACHRVGGTQTVAGDIDQSLANLQAAAGSADTTTLEVESENGALEVDTLELLFDCPADGAPPASGLGSKCSSDADCTANEACDLANASGTCAPSLSVATIGGACATTVDCGSDSRSACLTDAGDNYPGGYCGMEPCDDVQVCPPGGTCVSQPYETPGCLASCSTDADCRVSEGYVCQLFPTAPPVGVGPSERACGFPCKDDAGCTSPLLCDVASGKCTP